MQTVPLQEAAERRHQDVVKRAGDGWRLQVGDVGNKPQCLWGRSVIGEPLPPLPATARPGPELQPRVGLDGARLICAPLVSSKVSGSSWRISIDRFSPNLTVNHNEICVTGGIAAAAAAAAHSLPSELDPTLKLTRPSKVTGQRFTRKFAFTFCDHCSQRRRKNSPGVLDLWRKAARWRGRRL